MDYVDGELFLYLKAFKQRAVSPNTIEYKIGETIYDGAADSAGFLCEAYDYLRQGGGSKKKLSTGHLKILQESTFYAIEKKSLAYVIAIMNMILHGMFYQLDPGRSLGKTNPLNDNDLKEFVELQKGFKDSAKSWSLNVGGINQDTLDLSVKNPNAEAEAPLRAPKAIIKDIIALDKESEVILGSIQELV